MTRIIWTYGLISGLVVIGGSIGAIVMSYSSTWLGYLIAAIELLGGLAILIGVKTRWVAALLVLWLIIVTAVGHPFWTMEGAARGINQANFYKNLAIMGAYLLLAVTGAGRYSFDHRSVAVASKPAVATA